jgi:hypothetical protein
VPLQVSLLVGLCSLRGRNLQHPGSQAGLHIRACMDATGLSDDAGANFASMALFTCYRCTHTKCLLCLVHVFESIFRAMHTAVLMGAVERAVLAVNVSPQCIREQCGDG